jgi:hypothetical protein
MSGSLPAMGVITAPVIRNDARIHEEVLQEILKPSIRSGIAGSIMVSANIDTKPTQLNIARVI